MPRGLDAGRVVFREGDTSDTCYIVRTGHCRAIREHPDGRAITLAQFGPGDIFGELAMFDDETRSATIETIEAVDLIALLAADMRRLMREHSDIAVKLVVSLGRRLREANERISRQSFQTVQSRVATVVSQLATQAVTGGAAEPTQSTSSTGTGTQSTPSTSTGTQSTSSTSTSDVVVKATQAEIAQLAGSSRESASRFLAVLERAGVITQGRGRITVHDLDALQRYVY